ncbi:MAG: hypothetical protein GY928_15880 [Colwellia sp.]|nr:hypothetical protein [Colwellia sp.]
MDFLINLSITEILSVWELHSVNDLLKNPTARNVSNLLVILYAIIAAKTNKGCFFAAFFVDEIFSYSIIASTFDEHQYYLVIACIYSALYWYIENKNIKLNTLVACGIIVLFNAGMSLDAIFNKEAHSFMFAHYFAIVVSIHVYLISTLLEWKRIRSSMVYGIRSVFRVFNGNYNFTFIWYTVKKKIQQTRVMV